MSITKSVPLKSYSSMNFFYKDSNIFWHRKLTLKVRIWPFFITFVQLSARLKIFLGGWLLVLGIKEGLVDCEVILDYVAQVINGKKPSKPLLLFCKECIRVGFRFFENHIFKMVLLYFFFFGLVHCFLAPLNLDISFLSLGLNSSPGHTI